MEHVVAPDQLAKLVEPLMNDVPGPGHDAPGRGAFLDYGVGRVDEPHPRVCLELLHLSLHRMVDQEVIIGREDPDVAPAGVGQALVVRGYVAGVSLVANNSDPRV